VLIILEGVDGAGKTTLAEELAGRLDDNLSFKLMHSGPLKDDPLKEYEWRLRDYTPGTGQHVVCDRWHVGELVYGPLYRGSSKLTEPMRKHVEMYLDRLGAHKVVVSAPIATIQERLRLRGEDFLQDNHLGLVWDFYNEYAHQYGWGVAASDELPDHIIMHARRKESDASRLNPFHSYVGPVHPKHLLLGETQGATRYGRPAYDSAFVPYPDTSGHYLLKALGTTGVTDFGLANARDEDVSKLWHTLGRPNVICLGQEAEKLSRDVPHQTVPHPSYVRRFRNGDLKEYGHQIKELLR